MHQLFQKITVKSELTKEEVNPRDTDDNTENNRGYTVSSTRKLLENSGYMV